MAIKLNNFVNININHANQFSSGGSRNICTLILFDEDLSATTEPYEVTLKEYNDGFENNPEVKDIYTKYPVYIDSFFKNADDNSILDIIINNNAQPTSNDLKDIVSTLNYDKIIIASNLDYNNMKKACIDYNAGVSDKSMEKKIFLGYLPCSVEFTGTAPNLIEKSTIVKQEIENLAIKFGNEKEVYYPFTGTTTSFPRVYSRTGEEGSYVYTELEKDASLTGDLYIDNEGTPFSNTFYSKSEQAGAIPGKYVDKDGYVYTQFTQYPYTQGTGDPIACYSSSNENIGSDPIIPENFKGLELTIGAYLTKINIDRYESVQDYAFTEETIITKDFAPVEDNTLAVNLIDNSFNFIGKVLDKDLNLGGNDSKGYSLVNQFMLICLHQTLTEKIWGLLQNKIKYNNTGLNAVSSFITQELQRYVDNGYLSTNKTWTGEDLYNEVGVLIIRKNTPLTLGYKFVISPLSTLSLKDMQENKLPLISILIADAYAIRKINIDGTVF